MNQTPDVSGFRDAQKRLRSNLGLDVRFFTPLPSTWPMGTVLNPETQRPYDPTIRPVASGFATATIRCLPINKRLATEDSTQANAAGIFSDRSLGISMDIDDWPHASGATEFEIFERRYEIRDAQADGFANTEMRQLIYGEIK